MTPIQPTLPVPNGPSFPSPFSSKGYSLVLGTAPLVATLVTIGIWTNVLGYSSTLFPPPESLGGQEGYPTSDSFMAGRFLIALVLMVFGPRIQRYWISVTTATGIVMCAATCCALLAPQQTLFLPGMLSQAGVTCASMGYTLITSACYIQLSHSLPIRYCAPTIALGIVGEMVFSVLLSVSADKAGQVAVLLAAPIASAAFFLVGHYILERSAGTNDMDAPAVARGTADWTSGPYSQGEAAYAVLRLCVFTLALTCIRALSSVGIWGRERGNFIGMTELSPLELGIISALIVALSIGVFALPKKLSPASRSIIGFVFVLAGLQLLALSDSLPLSPVVGYLITGCELFSHLLMWVTFIECVQATALNPYRLVAARSIVYVISTILFGLYLDNSSVAPGIVILIVVYLLFTLVLLPLAINRIARHPSDGNLPAISEHEESPDVAVRIGCVAQSLGLTRRETEVFHQLWKGLTYTQIQNTCNMSAGTVRTHITNLYRKANVHSRQELVELVERDIPQEVRPK